MINILGPEGVGAGGKALSPSTWTPPVTWTPPAVSKNDILAVAPLCVTFNAVNDAWRRAKAVHFYGSGITNWRSAMCRQPAASHYGQNAARAREWRLRGMCNKGVSRAAFVRFIRDPLQ